MILRGFHSRVIVLELKGSICRWLDTLNWVSHFIWFPMRLLKDVSPPNHRNECRFVQRLRRLHQSKAIFYLGNFLHSCSNLSLACWWSYILELVMSNFFILEWVFCFKRLKIRSAEKLVASYPFEHLNSWWNLILVDSRALMMSHLILLYFESLVQRVVGDTSFNMRIFSRLNGTRCDT